MKRNTRIKTYIHHILEYINNAKNNGFEFIKMKEWFDKNNGKGLARLIFFALKK